MLRQGKSLIRKWLAELDIGTYRISESELDPLASNSRSAIDAHYRNLTREKRRLLLERRQLFFDVLHLVADNGIELEGKRVCDIGCGAGDLLRMICLYGHPRELVGYEYSETARLMAVANCPRAKIEPFDIYEGAKSEFDVLFCLEVLEHLLKPRQAIRRLVQMCGSQAAVILTVPDGRRDTYGGHINFWSPQSWRVFLEESISAEKILTGRFGGLAFPINWAIVKMPQVMVSTQSITVNRVSP